MHRNGSCNGSFRKIGHLMATGDSLVVLLPPIDDAFNERMVGRSEGRERVENRHRNLYQSAVGRAVGKLRVRIDSANRRIAVLEAERKELERCLKPIAFLVERFKGFYSVSLLDSVDIVVKIGTSAVLVAATYIVQRKLLELSNLFQEADLGAAVSTILTLGAFLAKGLHEQTRSPDRRRQLLFGFTAGGLVGSVTAGLLAISAFVVTNVVQAGEGVNTMTALQAAFLTFLALAEPAAAAAFYIAGKQKLRDARIVQPRKPRDRQTIEGWLKTNADSIEREMTSVSDDRAGLEAYARGEELFVETAEVDFQERCDRRTNELAARKHLAGLVETVPIVQAVAVLAGMVGGGSKSERTS